MSSVAALRRALAGVPAYLVGGTVRDLLLGRERADIDIALEGDVVTAAQRLGREVKVHERFGTATVRVNGQTVDLAATRAESYRSPGALPDVRPAALAEDLARRDFTLNAMAVPLAGDLQLIDPHRGAEDLQAARLRVLHPASFVDDPTRALRAGRYAARLGFTLEDETERLLRAAELGTVSEERIEAELRRLAGEGDPLAPLRLLVEWGLVSADVSLAGVAVGVLEQHGWSELADRGSVLLQAGAVTAGRFRARSPLAGARELAAAWPEVPSLLTSDARGRTGVELVLARALGAEWLDRYVDEWRHVRLQVGGNDLLAAGVPEGPAVGRGLAAALERKLDGEVSGREEELAAALEERLAREDQRLSEGSSSGPDTPLLPPGLH